jgi:hypothetical protein
MAEQGNITKAEFLAEIERAWAAFNAAIDRLTESQLTASQDEQGWTVKDHLAHLAAWERSTDYFLQGKPRHEGLGVAESLYADGDVDAVNEAIYRQHTDLPLSQVVALLRDTHHHLVESIQALSDDDLYRPYHYFLPDQPDDGRTAYRVIYGNTIDHYAEHLEWIDALLGGAP